MDTNNSAARLPRGAHSVAINIQLGDSGLLYTVTVWGYPYEPGVYHKRPEDCYPAEGGFEEVLPAPVGVYKRYEYSHDISFQAFLWALAGWLTEEEGEPYSDADARKWLDDYARDHFEEALENEADYYDPY
jgi:hypothetical protein